MSATTIIDNMGDAGRENRLHAAAYFINHPEQFSDLLHLTFNVNYKLHYKAAWVLEFVLEKHINFLYPHLDFFTSSLNKLSHDSAVRPIAKICVWLATTYVKSNDKQMINRLQPHHIESIVAVAFDWLIGDYKVATKVYSMQTLYLLGSTPKADKWIHTELRNIIAESMFKSSKAYQSRGQKILDLLNHKTV